MPDQQMTAMIFGMEKAIKDAGGDPLDAIGAVLMVAAWVMAQAPAHERAHLIQAFCDQLPDSVAGIMCAMRHDA